MPIIIPNFATDEKITAEKVNTGNEIIEAHINGNLQFDDFEFNQVESRHIHPPKFYGAPSPRGEFCSSDIVYRQTDHSTKNAYMMWSSCSTNWEPVPGLSMTVHVKPSYIRSSNERLKNYCSVIANWTCREITDDVATNTHQDPLTIRVAEYALFIKRPNGDVEQFEGTTRYLYYNGKRDNVLTTTNLSICTPLNITQGVNHIFIQQRIMSNVKRNSSKIYVFNRNIVCDVNYL